MKSMNAVFQNERIVELLHRLLTCKDTVHQKSSVAPNGEAYLTNQYYLFTVVDMIFKYMILFQDESTVVSFVTDLVEGSFDRSNEKEFILFCHQKLIDQLEEKLGLSEVSSVESKRTLLSYVYQHYIVDGYCFHSFPSTFQSKIKKEGLYPDTAIASLDTIRTIDRIFARHRLDYAFGRTVKSLERDYIEITDSPFLAFLYALESPEYYCRFTSNGPIARAIEKVDRTAYDRKDYDALSRNVEALCNEKDLSSEEKETVMRFVKSEWETLRMNEMIPVTAMIKRKAVGRDTLKDYEQILKHCQEEEVVYSLAKIMDSRYSKDKRYTKIIPAEFTLVVFPTYRELLTYEKKVEAFLEEPEEESSMDESIVVPNKHGNADIIAFTGILLIVLGLTWIIVGYYLKLS